MLGYRTEGTKIACMPGAVNRGPAHIRSSAPPSRGGFSPGETWVPDARVCNSKRFLNGIFASVEDRARAASPEGVS